MSTQSPSTAHRSVSADGADSADGNVKELVAAALTSDYVAFETIANRLPQLSRQLVRSALVELEDEGRAELAHGRGWRRRGPGEPSIPTLTFSLRIENYYVDEDDEIVTNVADAVVPAPTTDDENADDYDEWAETVIRPFTGTGRVSGQAVYDVQVTACDDPAMLNRRFAFGY